LDHKRVAAFDEEARNISGKEAIYGHMSSDELTCFSQRSCNNRDLHGFEGPIKVSFGNYTYPIKDDFLRAAESQGIPTTDDLQDLTTAHGAEHWLKWINRDTGRRSDSAHGYVHSTRAVHQNLHLMVNTKVDKVRFLLLDTSLYLN
jgi:hypothetical protein